MVKRTPQSATLCSSGAWANAFRDILVASINKGQFPLAILGLIGMSMIWRMPSADVSKLVFRIVDGLERGVLLGSCGGGIRWLVCARQVSAPADLSGAESERRPAKNKGEWRVAMYYCIMILAAGAILHFVYESIIAPSLRLELRSQLIRLGNEIRLLKSQNLAAADAKSEVVERQLCELQDSIDSLSCILFKFDLVTIYAISEEIDRDAGLKRRVEARARILDDCVLPEVRVLRSKQIRIATKALAVNSGPMLLWSVVPASLFVGYHTVFGKIKRSLTVPAPDLERFVLDERLPGVLAAK